MASSSIALRAVTSSVVLGPLLRCISNSAHSRGGPSSCAALRTKNDMTDADPIEPVSDEDLAAPGAIELARIRTEVRQVAQQVQALAAEVDHIRRLLTTGCVRSGTCGLDRGATYVIREQQMTQFLSSMIHALQTFLQQRAATPTP